MFLAIFIAIDWLHSFHPNAADARLIGEQSLPARNYLQLIFFPEQPWR
jgi:hypothetical protein